MELNQLARQVHEYNVNAGWWSDWPNKAERIPTARMLVITELAEAAEGVRKGLMDDHLPHLKMFDVELADAAIRLLDLAGALEITPYGGTYDKLWSLSQFEDLTNDLERLDLIVCCLGQNAMINSSEEEWVGISITHVFALAEFHNIDLLDIIEQKRAYNAQRADHKPENRAKEGGKKF